MTADWKDALASLSGLPDASPAPEQLTTMTTMTTAKTMKTSTTLHIVVEKKGRSGKVATIVEGFECSDDEVDDIARELRKRLGTGGSARGGEILIQGDRRDDVAAFLCSKGFKVKYS